MNINWNSLVNIEHPHDYTMKSNYGEMKTDIDLENIFGDYFDK